ncbi:MAG: helix-turn-helix transcriptional regulator [Pseudomonadota bacterium]
MATHPISSTDSTASLLRAARAEAQLSLRELADRANTSHATLSAYERGRKVPSITTYLRILEACGNAVDIRLNPRVRERDGIPRGEELQAVLALAAQFPVRASRHLELPAFPHG